MTPLPASTSTDELLARGRRLIDDHRALEAIELLHAANLEAPHPDVESLLAIARNRAYPELDRVPGFDRWPVPVELTDDERAQLPQIPRVAPGDLTADVLRRAINRHGSLHVPGLFDADRVAEFREGIDHVLALRAQNTKDAPVRRHSSWVDSLPVPPAEAASLARNWVAGDGGMLTCDSPHLLERLFTTFEALGLKEVLTGYLGERPVLSANKATLRRARLDGKTDWHQDGAFLGRNLRSLNVWVTLTDCGVDAPGMDLVPKRFESIQETGTGGAIFDWAVGPETVATLAVDAPVVRPQYQAGDAMFFDDLFLHRTALDPAMTHTRHALESWFFAPSAYPDGQVPLVW